MVNKKVKTLKKIKSKEADSAYFLKLVLYIIIGSQWLRIFPAAGSQIPIPLGLIIGIIFAAHDHFRIDRKIEYAILLIMALVSFWLPLGLEIHL